MKPFALLAAVLLLPALAGLRAQDTPVLRLMNGQTLPVTDLDDSTYTELRFTFDKNHFKREKHHIRARRKAGDYFNTAITSPKAEQVPVVLREGKQNRDNVYSALYPSGREKHYYFYDEEEGNYLTLEQMESYLAGQSDALTAAAGRGWFWAGVGAGAAAGFATRGSIWAVAFPPLFALSTQIPVVRIRDQAISNPAFKYDEDYAAGFEKQARSRNLIQALKGGAIGTALGLAVFAVIDNNF